MPRILMMVTSDGSLRLMSGLPSFLRSKGFEVWVSAKPGATLEAFAKAEGVRSWGVQMQRTPAPLSDLGSLRRTLTMIAGIRPDIVVSGTPKAGLLGMIASAIIRVPNRVYLLHGLRLETLKGWRRLGLWCMEWVTMRLATDVVAVSGSLRSRVIDLSLVSSARVRVLGSGSANGVDVHRFYPDAPVERLELDSGPTALFVGRLQVDKGVEVLAGALSILSRRGIRGNLLVVGGDDSALSGQLRLLLDSSGWEVRHFGLVDDVSRFMGHADLLCLPTKREGFGNVLIEAAASGVPAVATFATGVVDAVEDGVSGMLVEQGDIEGLADAMQLLFENAELRDRLGFQARRRAVSLFRQELVWGLWFEYLKGKVTD